jgi:DDE superfamily endonuclease
VKRRYQGAWLLVDNGYLAWPTTVPPIKSTNSQREIRFSRWLESMRKDVECTFGILKGRWRILKTGIRLGGVEKADKIFLTCCALHNWLLDVDGLSAPWEGAVPTNTVEDDEVMGGWDGEMGQHDDEDFDVLPAAIRDLNNPVEMRNYDQSGMGPGSDAILTDEELADCVEEMSQQATDDDTSTSILAGSPDHVQLVRKLSLAEFRKRLIVHFDIAYNRGEVKWPTKNGREE